MNDNMLSYQEAKRLLEMLKQSLISIMDFPARGQSNEFNVQGKTKRDIFTISIYRGKINSYKYNFGARIKVNGVMLLELHITPNGKHKNPNGEIIKGNHWHIYDEHYGRAMAFPALDLKNDDFVDNTVKFLDSFNVIEKPTIKYEPDIIEIMQDRG